MNLAVTFSLISFLVPFHTAQPTRQQQRWNKTAAVDGIPFCAFMLREMVVEGPESHYEVFILMEPDHINEENLRILFDVISKRYRQESDLQAWVYTDVEQLRG